MNNSLIQTELSKRLSATELQPDGSFRADITFDRAFPGFDGHFPGNPIVPAVCILSAAELAVRAIPGNQNLRIDEILQMKFKAPILPDDHAIFVLNKAAMTTDDAKTVFVVSVATERQPVAAKIKFRLS